MSTTSSILIATTIIGAVAGVFGSSSGDMISRPATVMIAAAIGFGVGIVVAGIVKLVKSLSGG